MTDEETVEAILDKAVDAFEIQTAGEPDPPRVLRAAIIQALKDARQPVAYEVPGFHLTYPTWEDAINGRD